MDIDELFSCRGPWIMGVLNCTPDSFSDGGRFMDAEKAVAHALAMEKAGAAIVDIGGESTRPGSDPVSLEEEKKRVLPVIEGLRKRSSVLISIDTVKPELAEEALTLGADIINDVSGLSGHEMRAVAAAHKAPVVLMHMKGKPKTMQKDPRYEDVVEEIASFFADSIALARREGIKRIILDPGIGFGKTVAHNLALIGAIGRFRELGCPILIGASRKSFLGTITGADVGEREAATTAINTIALLRGASILRVHDVESARQAIAVVEAFRDQGAR